MPAGRRIRFPARPAPADAGRTGRMLAGVLCLAMLVAGCTAGPSQRPPVAVRGDNMPAPPSRSAPAPAPPPLPEPDSGHSAVTFRDCTGGRDAAGVALPADRTLRVQCAQLTVEADPAQPGLGRTRIGLVRVALADAPDDRPPLLVVGDSATDPTGAHALRLAAQVPLGLLQRYTLVGLDRRGAGVDDLDCGSAFARASILNIDPGGAPAADLDALLEQARAVVQDCYLVHTGALGGFRTDSTASDVEQARLALGVQRLSALGVGDGAAALAGWARTHQNAVARLVLDGPPDTALDDPAATESRARAAEATFDAFAATCAAAPDCPLGPDPRDRVQKLVERLRGQPLAAVDGRRLTAGTAVSTVLAGLGEPAGWPDLAAALGAADGGDPARLLDRLSPLLVEGGGFEAALATACNDARRRLTPGEVTALTREWAGSYPLFGPTLAQRLLVCGPWPTPVGAPPAGHGDGLPPVLVIGTAHDARVPLDDSRKLAQATAGALFLSAQGAGTGAYPRTPCVTAVVDGLLVDGTLPADGTLCPP